MGYIIYKIVCDDVPEYVYVGSTQNFTKRKCKHKSDCNNENVLTYNTKIYSKIRENGNWDNWRMVVIHECEEGLTKRQAEMIEEEHRVKLQANLNMKNCYGCNKENKKEWIKEYEKINREKRRNQKRLNYEKNKDHINKLKRENRAKNKEKNKEKNREYDKAYREKNKERINDQSRERYKNNKLIN